MPVTGVGQFTGSTYMQLPLDVYASDFHEPPKSYMISSYGLIADVNGDIIAYEGTVVAVSTTDGPTFLSPYGSTDASTTVAGVLVSRLNLRNGGMPGAVQMANAVFNETKCRDNAVFGTVRAGSKTALGLKNIQFVRKDG